MLFHGRFLSDLPLFFLLEFYLPPLLALLHAFWAMGFRRGGGFFLLAGFMGFLSEIVALRWGAFGAYYTYTLEGPGSGLSVQGFPLIVSLYWATFIYIGYWLVSFPFRRGPERSTTAVPGRSALWGLVLLDGFCVTAIDLMIDPLQVAMGTWTWIGGGRYYQVPPGNFLGWYVTVCATTLLFRLWETRFPVPLTKGPACWIPYALYLVLFSGFSFSAVYLGLPELVMIGGFAMAPFFLMGMVSGIIWRNGRNRAS